MRASLMESASQQEQMLRLATLDAIAQAAPGAVDQLHQTPRQNNEQPRGVSRGGISDEPMRIGIGAELCSAGADISATEPMHVRMEVRRHVNDTSTDKIVSDKKVERIMDSVGSVLHGTGCCTPCAWFWKPQGCNNGVDCTRCHACPSGAVKERKKVKQAFLRGGTAPGDALTLIPESERP